jgi:hypothetical protein
MKQYIGISRDHSGSMATLASLAKADYNENIDAIRNAATKEGIDTIVTTVKCGVGSGLVERESVNSSVTALKPLTRYEASGQTPLFDSVGELVELLQKSPDAEDPTVSFLVMTITDGQENASRRYTGAALGKLIREKQATDRWTFVFRVPHGYKRELASLGIPEGNIQEWEQTERGFKESTAVLPQAMAVYYSARSAGVRSTDSFYANLANVSKSQIKGTMTDISGQVKFWPVIHVDQIRPFVETKLKGKGMILGAAFYQLSKMEKKVQSYKQIVIRDKKSGEVYAGDSARDLLGLPTAGAITLSPGNHGNYDIFVQSASVNRKLVPGTNVMYWDNYAATLGAHCPATYAGPVRGMK